MTTQARELAKLVSNAGDVNLGDDISLASDGAVLNFGADSDVTLTHVADTGLLLNSSRRIQFGDSGTHIRQSADGVLNITSDTEVEINATTVDINANVDISGNLVLGGNITIGDADSDDISFGGELTSHIVPNATNTFDLGTASKEWRNAYFDGTVTSDAFAGPLTGNVTGNASGTAATVTGAAQTNITSLGTLTALTVDEITINADTITATDDFILDVEGEIVLDANNGGQVQLKDNGTEYGRFFQDSNRLFIQSMVSDADILIRGSDNGSVFTALSFDMSEAGRATFNEGVRLSGLNGGTGLALDMSGSGDYVIKEHSSADILSFQGSVFHNFSSGNFGVGVVPANAKLEVVATSGEVFRADSNGGAYRLVANQSGVIMQGRIGIGISSPATNASAADSLMIDGSNDNYQPGGFNEASMISLDATNSEGRYAGIRFTHAGGTEGHFSLQRRSSTSDIADFVWQGYDGDANAYKEYMRLKNNGNLAINASNSGTTAANATASAYSSLTVTGGSSNGDVATNSAFAHFGPINTASGANTDGYISGISFGYCEGNNNYRHTAIAARAHGDGAARRDMVFLVNSAVEAASAALGDAKLTISSGNGLVSGDLNDTSDIGFKENIKDLGSVLDKVKQLKPRTFTWVGNKEAAGNSVGFVAQEVETVITDDTIVKGNDYNEENLEFTGKSLNTIGLVSYLTKAIQEQQVIIDDLKTRIETLEG